MTFLVILIPESPGWLVRKVSFCYFYSCPNGVSYLLPQGLYSQADRALAWLCREEEEFASEVETELKARLDKVWLSGLQSSFLQVLTEPAVLDPGCCFKVKKLLQSLLSRLLL